jgi:hypothetical protein
MELTTYVSTLRQEIAAAARAAGPDAEALAERLITPIESATRLVLQEAVSDAAQEISRDLAPGSVDVRLRGRDLGFVVDRGPLDRGVSGTEATPWPPAASPAGGPPAPQDAAAKDSDAGTARITVRLPETLKTQVEAAAEREGLSVNAYLVRTLGAALQPGMSDTTATAGAAGSATTSREWRQSGQLSGWFQ